MKLIARAKKLVFAMCLMAVPAGAFAAPLTLNIHPAGVLLGTFEGEAAFGVSDNVSLALLGSYSEGQWSHDANVHGSSIGAAAYVFLNGQDVNSVYIKPAYERGFLRGSDKEHAGSINYNSVKLIGGYHWAWDNGVNLNLGAGASYMFGESSFDKEPVVQIGGMRRRVPNGRIAAIIPTAEFTLGWSIR